MATEDIDYYALLEVSQDATIAQINKAFRQKSLKVHPDRNPDNPQAATLFHELRVAADILTDATQRAQYDALFNARNARKKRFEALDNKRKAQTADLERREQEWKQQRGEQAEAATRKQYELNRLKEQGRKLREEREKQLAAALNSQAAQDDEVQERKAKRRRLSVELDAKQLDPLDMTIRLKWVKQDQPALTSVEAVRAYVSSLVAPQPAKIDSVVLSAKFLANPSKGKNASAVISFHSLTAAKRVVDALSGPTRIESKSTRGVEAGWASGQEPAVLRSTAQAGGGGESEPTPAEQRTKQPTTKVDVNENKVLEMLRARERAKLEQEILEREAAGES